MTLQYREAIAAGVRSCQPVYLHMKKLILLIFAFSMAIIQACAPQILSEQLIKGPFVREEGTGAFSVRVVRNELGLATPWSVHAYQEVSSTEITKQYFQKIIVRQEGRAKHYPYLDFWVKLLASTTVVPVFFPDFWVEGSYAGVKCRQEPKECSIRDVAHAVSNEYFIGAGLRSIKERLAIPPSSTVSFYLNGRYQGELKLDSKGTATANPADYPETVTPQGPIKLTFKYGDAYAYSVLQPDEVITNINTHAATEGR